MKKIKFWDYTCRLNPGSFEEVVVDKGAYICGFCSTHKRLCAVVYLENAPHTKKAHKKRGKSLYPFFASPVDCNLYPVTCSNSLQVVY